MDRQDELHQLQARVRLLEERIKGLRASRRILMNLLASQEREKRACIDRLESENQRLQRRTSRYAREVLERNIRIMRLQEASRREGSDIS